MLIEWMGHSCFYITTKNGTTIAIDVFDETVGLPVLDKAADIVLATHEHFDHINKKYMSEVAPECAFFSAPGEYESHGIKIIGFPIAHDEHSGSDRGMVTAFLIEADGMRVLHLGDIGVVPSPEWIEKLGRVDILMIPVGGTYTLDAKGALDTMDAIAPNITIPMHYMVAGSNVHVASNHDFLARAAKREYDVSRQGGSLFDITADNLKKRDRIVVMSCEHC